MVKLNFNICIYVYIANEKRVLLKKTILLIRKKYDFIRLSIYDSYSFKPFRLKIFE